MSSKGEAKVKFVAETSAFTAAVKQVDASMRQLRSEMRLNSAQMGSSGQSAALLANKVKILQQESQQLSAKEQALTAKLQSAVSIFGANSAEAQRLTTQINGVKAAQETVRGKIQQTSDALEKQRQAEAQAESAAGKLSAAIQRQQSELDQLKQRYASAIIETGKEGAEAKQLESKIRSLNSELQQNKAKMSEAEQAARDLTSEERSLKSATSEAADGFTVAKGIVANFAADALMSAAQKAKELGRDMVDLGMNFETSLSKVQAISGATSDEMQTLESKARDLGASTTFTASQVADAFGYMALAGWDTQQSIEGIPGVLALAQAGSMDLAAASDLLTDYLSAFSLQASDASMMADVLAYAQGHANTNTEQLGEAFKNCAANCNAAGMDVQTTTAFISELSNQGLKGSEAGTALNAVMRDMTARMKDGAIAVGDTSVQVMDASGNYRDMADIVADVESATAGMGDAEKASALQATFTADSIKGLNLILNAGSGELYSFRDQLYQSGNAAQDMANVMTDNLGGDLSEMGSAFEEVGLKVYDRFQQPLRDAVQLITGSVVPGITWLVENFDSIAPVLAIAAAAMGSFAAVANIVPVISGVTSAISALSGGMAFLASPIGIAAVAVAGVAAALVYLWNTNDGFRDAVTSAWNAISGAVTSAWIAIQPTLQILADFLVNGVLPAVQFLVDGFGLGFASILEAGAAWAAGILQTVQGCLQLIQGVVEAVLGVIVGIFTGNFDMAKQGAADALNGLLSIATGMMNSVLAVITGALNAVVSVFTGQFNAAKSIASGVFSGIASLIGEHMGNAQNVVSNALNAISGFFSGLHLSFPHIALPHFTISGGFSLDPPSVPSFGVEFYAKGAILTAPTVFGMNGGKIMVGGEAEHEAVLPISLLQGYIDSAFQRNGAGTSNTVNVTVNTSGGDADEIANEVAFRVFGAIDQAMAANGR